LVVRAVVDHGEIELGLVRMIAVGPFLEMAGEPGVGDDIDALEAADGRQVVEHIFDHRPAGDVQEGFGLGEGQGVKARGVAGGEEDDFHGSSKRSNQPWFSNRLGAIRRASSCDRARISEPLSQFKANSANSRTSLSLRRRMRNLTWGTAETVALNSSTPSPSNSGTSVGSPAIS